MDDICPVRLGEEENIFGRKADSIERFIQGFESKSVLFITSATIKISTTSFTVSEELGFHKKDAESLLGKIISEMHIPEEVINQFKISNKRNYGQSMVAFMCSFMAEWGKYKGENLKNEKN